MLLWIDTKELFYIFFLIVAEREVRKLHLPSAGASQMQLTEVAWTDKIAVQVLNCSISHVWGLRV